MFRKFLVFMLLMMSVLLFEVVLEFGDAFKESMKSAAGAKTSKPHVYQASHTTSGVYNGGNDRDR